MVGARAGLATLVLLAAASAPAERAWSETNKRTIEPRDLVTLRDLDGLSISADGAWAAFQVRQADPRNNSYDTAWYVAATRAGAAPQRVADAGEPIQPAYQGRVNGAIRAQPPAWSPDGEWIVYLRRDGGRMQIWRSRRDGRQTEQLTRNAADVRALAFSDDGKRLLFETEPSRAQIETALASEGRTGFLYDRRFSPIYDRLPTQPEDATFEDLRSHSGRQVAAREVWVYELAFRSERLATPPERAQYSSLAAATPPAVANCIVARDRSICLHEQPDYPRRLVAIDSDTGASETLYDPNPGFARLDLGPPPQRLVIRAAPDIETYSYLVLPPGYRSGGRLPLIVVTYRCGGFLRGGTGDEHPIYAFAAHGFAVLCFDVPDKDPAALRRMSLADYRNWKRGPGDPEKHRVQQGLQAAIARVDAMGVVDPQRIGLTGLSFGAETVSFALFSPHAAVTTAIASGAGVEPSDTFLYGPAGRELLRGWGLESPVTERWNQLALSRNAQRVRAPLLLNVADREMLAALEPVVALQAADRAVEMYVFPDEYHIKWQPAHRLAIYNRNIDWMNFWLRGVEDPAPAKADQYKRWRAMRVKQCELFKGDDAPWYCETAQQAAH